ncbi:hypothetical protein HDU96_001056, partial [Phlyctochytrium bullatum]
MSAAGAAETGSSPTRHSERIIRIKTELQEAGDTTVTTTTAAKKKKSRQRRRKAIDGINFKSADVKREAVLEVSRRRPAVDVEAKQTRTGTKRGAAFATFSQKLPPALKAVIDELDQDDWNLADWNEKFGRVLRNVQAAPKNPLQARSKNTLQAGPKNTLQAGLKNTPQAGPKNLPPRAARTSKDVMDGLEAVAVACEE